MSKMTLKDFYFQEKYRHYIRCKKKEFNEQYILLSNIYDKH